MSIFGDDLSEVRIKEMLAMNTRYVILPTIFLAMLCLGNANNALAQSVTGGGTGHPGGGGPFVINVSARSGPAGIMHFRENDGNVFAEVVSLCVPPDPGNEAIVVGQITQSTVNICAIGDSLILVVEDNGPTGDIVNVQCTDVPTNCEDVTLTGTAELMNGNIIVSP
jgi:hypothetical protein